MTDNDNISEMPKDKSLLDLLAIMEQQKSEKINEPSQQEEVIKQEESAHEEKVTEQEESAPKAEVSKQEEPAHEEEAVKAEELKIEQNPDLEDPRLYSPLQETDRPNPKLRAHPDEDESTPPEEE
ncbi:hypothetical protein ACFLYL_02835 [Chloroflexota bacterium]